MEEPSSRSARMTQSRQNRTESTLPNLLSPKTITRIGTWNVRSMYEGRKALTIAKEMRSYNLQLLGLCETRWIQAGQARLTTGELILYSGHMETNAHHTEGVGFILSKAAQRSLVSWEPISSRIITAQFKTGHRRIKLKVVQCYAPTNDAVDTAKEDFYDRLQVVLEQRKEREILVLMGDFNAKVGANNIGYEQILGKHGLGQMNENGELFADFYADNNIVIGGSIFPHKDIHKVTWVSPDHITENQIDHIGISTKFRRTLLDVRAKRGADAASDHHLVVGKLRLKIKRCVTRSSTRTKYNVQLLQEEAYTEAFQLTPSNKYQALQELQDNEEVGDR